MRLMLIRRVLAVSAVMTIAIAIAVGNGSAALFEHESLRIGGTVVLITVWLAAILHGGLYSRRAGLRRWLLIAVLVVGSFPVAVFYYLFVVLPRSERETMDGKKLTT